LLTWDLLCGWERIEVVNREKRNKRTMIMVLQFNRGSVSPRLQAISFFCDHRPSQFPFLLLHLP
jgi:hypothetical protein